MRIYYEKLVLSRQGGSSELDEHQRKIREQFGLDDVPERGDGVVLIDIVSPVREQVEAACRQFATARMRDSAEKESQAESGEGSRFLTQLEDDGSVQILSGGVPAPLRVTGEQVRLLVCGQVYERVLHFDVTTQTLETDYDRVVPACQVCGKTAKFRCTRCKRAWYCGRECQVRDWKAGHKAQCKAAAAEEGARRENDELMRLVKKIAVK